jgi:hypothetical protein
MGQVIRSYWSWLFYKAFFFVAAIATSLVFDRRSVGKTWSATNTGFTCAVGTSRNPPMATRTGTLCSSCYVSNNCANLTYSSKKCAYTPCPGLSGFTPGGNVTYSISYATACSNGVWSDVVTVSGSDTIDDCYVTKPNSSDTTGDIVYVGKNGDNKCYYQ